MEGVGTFWLMTEAQSSLRDFHLSRSLTQHGSQRRRTVLGYFRPPLRGLAGTRVDTPGWVLNTLLR